MWAHRNTSCTASLISLKKPGLNNLNDLSNIIPGEPLPGQIMEISIVVIHPGRGSREKRALMAERHFHVAVAVLLDAQSI